MVVERHLRTILATESSRVVAGCWALATFVAACPTRWSSDPRWRGALRGGHRRGVAAGRGSTTAKISRSASSWPQSPALRSRPLVHCAVVEATARHLRAGAAARAAWPSGFPRSAGDPAGGPSGVAWPRGARSPSSAPCGAARAPAWSARRPRAPRAWRGCWSEGGAGRRPGRRGCVDVPNSLRRLRAARS